MNFEPFAIRYSYRAAYLFACVRMTGDLFTQEK